LACEVIYNIETSSFIHEDSGLDKPTFRVKVNDKEHGEFLSSPKHGIDRTVINKVLKIKK
jgi:hypothetical protein